MKKFMRLLISFALAVVIGASVISFSPRANASEAATVDTSDPFAILASLDETKGANNVYEEYRLNKSLDVAYGKVYKFLQVSGGYDVYGSDLIVSVDKNGNVLSVDGKYINIPNLTENLTKEDIIKIVDEHTGGTQIYHIEKLVFAHENAPELAYKIVFGNDDGKCWYVSAVDGEILYGYTEGVQGLIPITQTDGNGNSVEINVTYREEENQYVMIDETKNIFLIDLKNGTEYNYNDYLTASADNIDNETESFDPIAVSAWNNINKTYDFYTDASNLGVAIKGVDGNNDDIDGNYDLRHEVVTYVYVHYGEDYDNAYCTYYENYKMALITIGDGDPWGWEMEDGSFYPRGRLKDPARALDILGHEYQHAISTEIAGLNYVSETGALNEAFSDIIGMLIEGKTGDDFWGIGEDGANSYYTYLRSADGTTRGQVYDAEDMRPCRWHTSESEHDENCDYDGVHTNSTIITHLQYKMSQAMPEYFTHERIGALWYATLCTMTDTSDFDDFAMNFLHSAINLDFSDEAVSTIRSCLESSHLMPENAYHTVQFVDYDGTLIKEVEVLNGGSLDQSEFPADPTREADNTYTYTFSGWDKGVVNVTEDLVITAQYNVFYVDYTVTVLDMVGEVISSGIYHYGDEFDVSALTEPDSPGVNWTFDGYYADADYTTRMENFSVSADTTIYAHWTYQAPPEDPSGTTQEPSDDGKDCGTIAFGGSGSGGTGLMIGLTLVASACVALILTKKRKVNE